MVPASSRLRRVDSYLFIVVLPGAAPRFTRGLGWQSTRRPSGARRPRVRLLPVARNRSFTRLRVEEELLECPCVTARSRAEAEDSPFSAWRSGRISAGTHQLPALACLSGSSSGTLISLPDRKSTRLNSSH